ncbi:MAG TPA: LamG-like jellyroll fold domain-containing protein [Phycisphaerae bacterium]|nr:LamG-like jellyroll fold domain-containing protein [Phycisphaerae bacterium]
MNKTMLKTSLVVLALAALVPPAFGSGVFVRSESDYLSLADGSWANLSTNSTVTGWTISCWVKVATLDGIGVNHHFWSFTDGTNYRRLTTPESDTGGDRFNHFYRLNASLSGQTYDTTTWTSNPSTTVWTHMAITASYSSNYVYHKFWFNGTNTHSPNGIFLAGGVALDPTDIFIGALNGSTFGLNGKIAEVTLWPRVLTQTEFDKLAGINGQTKRRAIDLETTPTYSMYLPLYSNATEAGSISVTNNGVTFDTSDDPFPGDDPYASDTYSGRGVGRGIGRGIGR